LSLMLLTGEAEIKSAVKKVEFTRLGKWYTITTLSRDVCNGFAMRVRELGKNLAPSDHETKMQLEEIAISAVGKRSISWLVQRHKARWGAVVKKAMRKIHEKHELAEEICKQIPYPKDRETVHEGWIKPSTGRDSRAKDFQAFNSDLMGDCAEFLVKWRAQPEEFKEPNRDAPSRRTMAPGAARSR
jgi:hypothetical protein